jgi:hypothetical protein
VTSAPEWPWIDLSFDLPAADVASILSRAAAARRYSEPRGRDSMGYLRLGGTVDGQRFDLSAKPYLAPGIRAGSGSLACRLQGEVVDAAGGSRLTAQLSAPIPRTTILLLAGWVLLLLALSRALFPFSIVLIASVIPMWWVLARYNQRQALRWADDVRAFLRAIVVDGRA